MKILIFILLVVFLPANTFTTKVVQIIDKNSSKVQTDQKETIYVRLEGINCPERGRDSGTIAKPVISDLCFGVIGLIYQMYKQRYVSYWYACK